MAEQTQPADTKTAEETKSRRQSREVEVVTSDRIALVAEANAFVRSMVNKQIVPMIDSTTRDITELTQAESRTYEAALEYLGRQFSQGHRETEVFDKKSETGEERR